MRTRTKMFLVFLFSPMLFIGLAYARQSEHLQPVSQNEQANVQREVGHELTMVPWYTVFDIVKYNVSGSEVTLTGAVTEPTVKTDAENAVKHIEGVQKVNDQIEVLPLSPMDDQIRRAEYRAIYSQGPLSKYGIGALQAIHIIVKGGHVTLEGTVNSDADKNVANIAASHVANVFSVTNNLVVSGSK